MAVDRHPASPRAKASSPATISAISRVLGAVDIMQPDLAICGGITEAHADFGDRQRLHPETGAAALWAGAPAFFAAGQAIAAASPPGSSSSIRWAPTPLLHDLVEEDFPS